MAILTKMYLSIMSNKIKLIPLSRKLRLLNFIIDAVVIYFLWWLISYLIIISFNFFFDFDFTNKKLVEVTKKNGEVLLEGGNRGELIIMMLITLLISIFNYYFILELYFQKTLGKALTGSKVIEENGEKASVKKIILRTICRFIPIDWISFIFFRNGIHDRLSKTKVIRE